MKGEMPVYDELVKALRGFDDYCRQINQNPSGIFGQAADAIEGLICEVADEHNARLDAEERHRWIPVSDHPPEQQDEYLVLWKIKDPNAHQLFYEILEYEGGGHWVGDIPQAEPFGGFEVAFWQPLPELPEEGE